MRSVSLLCEERRWAWRWRESLSPGKVKEPGRLTGEAGIELQKEPFCRGLLGGNRSLPKGEGRVVPGEFIGEGAPGLAFPNAKGPMLLLRRISSELPQSSLGSASAPLGVFWGLSVAFPLGVFSASLSGPFCCAAPGGCLPAWLRPASRVPKEEL